MMVVKVLLLWAATWVYLRHPPPRLAGATLLAAVLILASAVELTGVISAIRAHYNLHLFDFYGVAEFLLLAGFGLAQFRQVRVRRAGMAAALALAVGLSIWEWPAMVADDLSASRSLLVNSLVLSGLFLVVLFRLAFFSLRPLHRVPLFWIALGLVIFFGVELPYRGLYNLLNATDLDLARKFTHINDITFTLRYGLVIMACLVGVRYPPPPEPWTTSASPSS